MSNRKNRFTPLKMRKWEAMGRGTGTYAEYQPWHQVSRDDPASRGRSHVRILPHIHRLAHLLSDGESLVLYFALLLPSVVDMREQFRLCPDQHEHHLSEYSVRYKGSRQAGTIQIAGELGIKHPTVSKEGDAEPWRFTTDLVLTIENLLDKEKTLLAIAYKSRLEGLSKRKLDLLRVEREYWIRQKIQWLLLSPAQYSTDVARTVILSSAWGASPHRVPHELLTKCGDLEHQLSGHSLSVALRVVEQYVGLDSDMARFAFWQSVWGGFLPIDLSEPIFRRAPIRIVSHDEFHSQNPLYLRRSACL